MYQKRLLFTIIIILVICSCGHKSPVVNLTTLIAADINSPAYRPLIIPDTSIWKERKHNHDSCFGFQFEPNALFLGRSDSFFLGSIYNKETMQPVLKVDLRNYGLSNALKAMTIISKPCYDQSPFRVSVDAFFNKRVIVSVPNETENINEEVNNAIRNSPNTEVELGSWSYISLHTSGIHVLDTTSDQSLSAYKNLLLDKDNIVLIRIAGANSLSFTVKSKKNYSGKLIKVLENKPVVNVLNLNLSAQLFYIDDNTFQISFVGFYPIMGEFMKCVTEQQ